MCLGPESRTTGHFIRIEWNEKTTAECGDWIILILSEYKFNEMEKKWRERQQWNGIPAHLLHMQSSREVREIE